MTLYKRFFPNITSSFWFVMMIVMWLAFAPRQAGGMASYIIVIGNSMEPNFHIGDLIIVHEEPRYEVGDAVVYDNRELGNFVFHRIIAEKLGRFTLKGDNNSWTDTYEPAQQEVLGKLWVYVPKGGSFIQIMRNPIVMALTAGLLAGFITMGFFKGKSKGKRQMNKEWFASIKQKLQTRLMKADNPEPSNPYTSDQGHVVVTMFFALGLVAFVSFILGIISFSRPATRFAKNDISYDQLGFFIYTASSSQGVYDSGTIQSGDPIFPKLTCVVDMNFQYTLVSQQAENISGTYQLTATIAETTSGWQRTLALQDEATFKGNTFGTNAKLDLCKMERLTQAMEEGTDFHPGAYTLTISPNIKVAGTISNHALESTFNPALAFTYDRIHFYLVNDEEQGTLLNVSETGVISNEEEQANTVKFFGKEFAVPALRLIAVIGLILSLGGLLFLGSKLQALSKSDPSQFIRAKFGSMMIDIQHANVVDSKTTIDVSSIDDLGKLAERFNAMILHTEFSESHAYYVQDEGTTYRFVMGRQETGSNVPKKDAGKELQ
ncbi:MAG: signal peptidase I [Anaerolineales bacterium]|nr:signal peptidase I [Anaerolineales bacterium]